MKINTDLYVKDVPGQLVSSLEPISAVDGNIVGVVHNREQIMNDRIVVNVTFNIDGSQLENLKKIWKSKDVLVGKIDSVIETFSMVYMLIGDITATYVDSLFEESSRIVALESIDIRYSSKNSGNSHTAMISVKVRSEDDLQKLDVFLTEASKKAKFLYIRGVGQ